MLDQLDGDHGLEEFDTEIPELCNSEALALRISVGTRRRRGWHMKVVGAVSEPRLEPEPRGGLFRAAMREKRRLAGRGAVEGKFLVQPSSGTPRGGEDIYTAPHTSPHLPQMAGTLYSESVTTARDISLIAPWVHGRLAICKLTFASFLPRVRRTAAYGYFVKNTPMTSTSWTLYGEEVKRMSVIRHSRYPVWNVLILIITQARTISDGSNTKGAWA
ncbi:hypothetical protein BJY52DRAFT_1227545 [Lactarius psammicola]|nr:hypothetical protein BJY52DRAFT_1227545 [Lactarius psammicola]